MKREDFMSKKNLIQTQGKNLKWYLPGRAVSTIALRGDFNELPNIGYGLYLVGTKMSLVTRIGAGDNPNTPYHDEFLQIEEFEDAIRAMAPDNRYLQAIVTNYGLTDRDVSIVFIFPGQTPQEYDLTLKKGVPEIVYFKVKLIEDASPFDALSD